MYEFREDLALLNQLMGICHGPGLVDVDVTILSGVLFVLLVCACRLRVRRFG